MPIPKTHVPDLYATLPLSWNEASFEVFKPLSECEICRDLAALTDSVKIKIALPGSNGEHHYVQAPRDPSCLFNFPSPEPHKDHAQTGTS